MDAEAHGRVSHLTRSAIVVTSTLSDIIINYPLWVYAKRIQASLGPPKLGEIYKGGGALFFCCATGSIGSLREWTNRKRAAHSPSALQTVCAKFPVDKFLRARHIRLVKMFDDHRNIRVLFSKPLQIIIVIQNAEPRCGQFDGSDTAE